MLAPYGVNKAGMEYLHMLAVTIMRLQNAQNKKENKNSGSVELRLHVVTHMAQPKTKKRTIIYIHPGPQGQRRHQNDEPLPEAGPK